MGKKKKRGKGGSRGAEAEVLNMDGALTGALNAIVSNSATGTGTARDPSTGTRPNTGQLALTVDERNALLRSSRVARKIIYTYPNDALRCWPTFRLSDESDASMEKTIKLMGYLDALQGPGGGRQGVRSGLAQASGEGRLHGDGYLLLGVEDGLPWEEPVNEESIKSIRWVKVLYHHEVTPETMADYADPWAYLVSTYRYSGDPTSGERLGQVGYERVHRSRIVRIPGDSLHGTALQANQGANESVFEGMFKGFSGYLTGMSEASYMLTTHSLFKYGLAGFGGMVMAEEIQPILKRFLTIQMGMSNAKGIIYDMGDEEVDFATRNFSGVEPVLQALTNAMLAEIDMPRYKVMGSAGQGGGLSNEGRGTEQRAEWAECLESWQFHNWREPLLYLGRLAAKAQDSGVEVDSDELQVEFPSSFKLTDQEQADLFVKLSTAHSTNINSGAYTAHEARSSFADGGLKIGVELDEAVSERLKDEAINPPDPIELAKAAAGIGGGDGKEEGEDSQGRSKGEDDDKDEDDDLNKDSDSPDFSASEILTEEQLEAIADVSEEDVDEVAENAVAG